MGVGGNENRVEVVNTMIDMDNNSDGDKDGSKYNNDYDDGDDEDEEDDNNDDGEDNDDENNNATDSEESDDRKGKIDTGISLFIGLDERVYAAINTLRNMRKSRYWMRCSGYLCDKEGNHQGTNQ